MNVVNIDNQPDESIPDKKWQCKGQENRSPDSRAI